MSRPGNNFFLRTARESEEILHSASLISVENQIVLVLEEAIVGIEQVPGYLQHPVAVWSMEEPAISTRRAWS